MSLIKNTVNFEERQRLILRRIISYKMKRFVSLFLSFILLFSAAFTGCSAGDEYEDKSIILTTFYPVYIFTLNLLDGIEDVKILNMTENHNGCLHDYTLMPKDMKALATAKAVVINGAGMEEFLEKATEMSDAPVIDSSQGIEIIGADDEDSHNHEAEEEHGHDHDHEGNAHIWMSPKNAARQTENIAAGLIKVFPQYEKRISENLEIYLQKLYALDSTIKTELASCRGAEFISFHEAYDYFAEDYSLVFAASFDSDDGAEPGTKELVRLTELIKSNDIKAIFTEPDYKGSAAQVLSNETGVPVYTLNPVTSGDGSKDSYEKIMLENCETIKKAVLS